MAEGKKILIVSCSTGSGHFRAAEALRLTCEKLYPNTQIVHLDMADYLDGLAYIYVVSFYSFTSNLIPLSYKIVYHITDRWFVQPLFKILGPIIALGSKRFLKRIREYQPDLIVSTHYLPPFTFPKNFSAPVDLVITDYYAHKIWLSPRIRNFFVPTEEIKNEIDGFKIKSIASGIPIHPNFFEDKNIADLKSKFNIYSNRPTILFMPTASGKIDLIQALDKILNYNFNQPLNIVAISGKSNEKTFNRLNKLRATNRHHLIVLKNTENIDELMRLADIIIGKAGGLTISEAVCLQKPFIVINPIPGQEDYNTEYLEKNHYGLKAVSTEDLTKKIQLILSNPELLQKKIYPVKSSQSEAASGEFNRVNPDPSKIILEHVLAEK